MSARSTSASKGGSSSIHPSTGSCRSRRFEHFGFERYDDYFKTCYDILPDDGRMTIQSSCGYHPYDLQARGKKLTFELATVREVHR